MKPSTLLPLVSILASLALAGASFFLREQSLLSWTILALGAIGTLASIWSFVISSRDANFLKAAAVMSRHSAGGGL